MSLYNKIGNNYNQHRTSDERIAKRIVDLLNLGAGMKVADIGAGTGNYSLELALNGYSVYALEPSILMLQQKKEHPNIKWVNGKAEDSIFNESTFDGVCSILATHHFDSLEKAFIEMKRILKPKGSLVIFTADPRIIPPSCWFNEYFDFFIKKAEQTLPPINALTHILNDIFKNEVEIEPFLVPYDIKDGFFYAGWRTPEKYLCLEFRESISVFATCPQDIVNTQIERLKIDLESGEWDRKYHHIRQMTSYEGGYYFIKVQK